MVRINHFALSAMLGSTIGPRAESAHGQIGAHRLAVDFAALQRDVQQIRKDLLVADNQTDKYFRAVIRAFQLVRDGYAIDRVIADPKLNTAYIQACRNEGLEDSEFRLNRTLLMLRKSKRMQGLRSEKRSVVFDQWRFAPASEYASRLVFFHYGATVDTILCHPKLRQEFDRSAVALIPGWKPFEYRWAALNIRKQGSSKDATDLSVDEFANSAGVLFSSRGLEVPDEEGVFVLMERDQAIYVANTENLRDSFGVQQELVFSSVIPRTLWSPKAAELRLQYLPIPDSPVGPRARLANYLIGQYRPIFNIPRAA